jgi:hypothetical protein
MKLELKPGEIAYPGALEIAVEGFPGDTTGIKPSQVLIEVYEGKLRFHLWTENGEDPTVTIEIEPLAPKRVRRRCVSVGR